MEFKPGMIFRDSYDLIYEVQMVLSNECLCLRVGPIECYVYTCVSKWYLEKNCAKYDSRKISD